MCLLNLNSRHLNNYLLTAVKSDVVHIRSAYSTVANRGNLRKTVTSRSTFLLTLRLPATDERTLGRSLASKLLP